MFQRPSSDLHAYTCHFWTSNQINVYPPFWICHISAHGIKILQSPGDKLCGVFLQSPVGTNMLVASQSPNITGTQLWVKCFNFLDWWDTKVICYKPEAIVAIPMALAGISKTVKHAIHITWKRVQELPAIISRPLSICIEESPMLP